MLLFFFQRSFPFPRFGGMLVNVICYCFGSNFIYLFAFYLIFKPLKNCVFFLIKKVFFIKKLCFLFYKCVFSLNNTVFHFFK
jgi:hypothetical protein